MKLIKKLDTRMAKNNNMNRFGLFLCSYCNKEVEKRLYDGMKGKSCGCMHGNLIRLSMKTHSGKMPASEYHRLYGCWQAMKDRCYNHHNNHYKDYGGRSIRVCKQWKYNYVVFKIWALMHGYMNNLILDRIDNDRNYGPNNCKWGTYTERAHKRRNNTLNWIVVRLVRVLYEDGYTVKMLFKIFDMTKSNLRHILNNATWKEEVA